MLISAERRPGELVENESWVVETKMSDRMVEVSAVQENAFGKLSWGWAGIDKFIVMSSNSYREDDQESIDHLAAAQEAAQFIVDGKNAKLVK